MINFNRTPTLINLPSPHLNKYQRVFILFFLFSSFTGAFSYGQQKITGIVTNNFGAPLFGATVIVQGANTAATTLSDGSFTLNANPGDVLEISFVGHKSFRIKINNETNLKIALIESEINLDEIIVTGYGSQKRKEITGSVSIVKPKDLTAVPAGQVEQMLPGRVAGLNVITSGMPGGPSNVYLHGLGNFGDVTPLYIIDGVQGNINNLNPDDIESFQVLKDAGAYSIYGVRGANGVIVITTRNGKQGKTKVSYDFYIGTTRPPENSGKLSPAEMASLNGLVSANSGQPFNRLYGTGSSPIVPDFFIAGENIGIPAGDPRVNPDLYNIDFTNNPNIYQIVQANKSGTDWFHEAFKPAFSQNHSLTFSGANEKNNYLFSLGYLDQQGTLLYTYLKRYTVRVNTEFSINNHIRVGENLQLMYRDNPIVLPDGPGDNEMASAQMSSPLLPVYDIKGGWAHFLPNVFYDNPIAYRTNGKDDKSQSWETFGNAYAEADFLKHFSFRTNFGGNLTHYNTTSYAYFSYKGRADNLPDNSFRESSGHRNSWTWTNTVRFSKTFNSNHSVKGLIGTEAISNYYREAGGRSAGFFNNDVNYRFLSNGSAIADQSNYGIASHSSLFSLFSRVDYGFKEKYFLSGTLRRDGASVFAPTNRYGWFPSISAAWRLSEENFLNQSKWLNELKLRGSWGKTGFYGNTDPLNQYTLFGGSVSNSYYDITGNNSPTPGFRNTRIGDPNTGWQEDIVTNIGLESVFWNGKLSFTADWYLKKAKGLLFPVTLPDVLGGATPPNINVGQLENKGFDLLIGSKGRWSKDWSWEAAVTFSAYDNRITKVNELPFFIPQKDYGYGPIANEYVRNQVGQPISSFYGFKVIGIFKDAGEVNKAPVQDGKAPGRFRYLDTNNDDTISADDRVFFGNPNPDFTLGINLGVNFQNIDFTVFFYGSFGNEVINLPKYWSEVFQTNVPFVLFPVKSKEALYNSWTPQRTNTTIPIQETDHNFSTTATVHSYPLEDGSYFRNKSMMLGYTFPKAWLQKMRIERLRVYVQAVNLFTITNYSGLDPELSGQSAAFGIDYGNYPNQRQYLFGLNINF